ncbi:MULTISPECIES: DUF3397 domain-containing protein [Anoxybacillus]|uniref:DUF3397 domain-containing protein n=1 Tax=Anoxybacillus flavithermus TaxID=33934 RepID=A0A178THW2_9BACL|nr:DUF3397 domain-containing protein [Anoxybacillus flavithermus]ASA96308.1 hypothetical protein CA592_05385 [Anoxybacillus flavithermus]ELK21401.1 hypothetical protein AF6_1821 [Anoxybacillus flavithermus TNO-09.006]MBE2903976.1 DUF3397 domain-containing protein [Anoxybacillus flavithermus]MBE2906812.1 DUF3397 domain-containing protein [Anoxybacillus flavithermus]MBE2909392.1 DUF3397 domain-containing protein [Anoxybacillus flavithermus]
MKDILTSFIAIMIVMPFLSFFFIFTLAKAVFKRKGRRAFHVAVNGSTIFFIFAVHVLLQAIFRRSYIVELLIFFIVTLMIGIVWYWKKTGDVSLQRTFKLYWKMQFLLFTAAYIGLFIYGIIHRVMIAFSS